MNAHPGLRVAKKNSFGSAVELGAGIYVGYVVAGIVVSVIFVGVLYLFVRSGDN
jgi:hypothetical protein